MDIHRGWLMIRYNSIVKSKRPTTNNSIINDTILHTFVIILDTMLNPHSKFLHGV